MLNLLYFKAQEDQLKRAREKSILILNVQLGAIMKAEVAQRKMYPGLVSICYKELHIEIDKILTVEESSLEGQKSGLESIRDDFDEYITFMVNNGSEPYDSEHALFETNLLESINLVDSALLEIRAKKSSLKQRGGNE